MATLLIKNAHLLVTMDAQRREIPDGAVFVRDNVIEAVGSTAELPAAADEVIDAHDQIVIPGLVNTHHHMYQTLPRAACGAGLRAVQLAAGLVPGLGQPDAGDGAGVNANGDGRAAAVALHHKQRPPLHLPERHPAP